MTWRSSKRELPPKTTLTSYQSPALSTPLASNQKHLPLVPVAERWLVILAQTAVLPITCQFTRIARPSRIIKWSNSLIVTSTTITRSKGRRLNLWCSKTGCGGRPAPSAPKLALSESSSEAWTSEWAISWTVAALRKKSSTIPLQTWITYSIRKKKWVMWLTNLPS